MPAGEIPVERRNMKIKFNDATELQVQKVEVLGQGLRILAAGTTPEQLRELFSDPVKTKVIRVEERGQTLGTYENYTEYDHTEEYTGKIYGIVMNRVGKSTEERIQENEKQLTEVQLAVCELYEMGAIK